MGLYVDRETRNQLKGESHKGKSKKARQYSLCAVTHCDQLINPINS
jgi:hypothetical protein